MTLISSDTNIWLDFEAIGELDVPFLLPYTYLMAKKAISKEILRPEDLALRLKRYGLKGVTLDETEELLVESYSSNNMPKCFRRLTNYDRMALAIAKNRGIMLLTGDNYLRQAAEAEHVPYMGTIGLLDKLNEAGFREQYSRCLQAFYKALNDVRIRLPKEELKTRLDILEASEGGKHTDE